MSLARLIGHRNKKRYVSAHVMSLYCIIVANASVNGFYTGYEGSSWVLTGDGWQWQTINMKTLLL